MVRIRGHYEEENTEDKSVSSLQNGPSRQTMAYGELAKSQRKGLCEVPGLRWVELTDVLFSAVLTTVGSIEPLALSPTLCTPSVCSVYWALDLLRSGNSICD